MEKRKVLVIGGDHHNTLGVIESLAYKGIRSYVIILTNRNNGYVLHSKNIVRGWCCHDENEAVECIISNFKDIDHKAVAIATNDQAAVILDRNSQLRDFLIIPTTKPYGELSSWMNKEKMSSLAATIGLNVPQSWLLVDSNLPDDISYPVITKAISSVEGTKENIHIFYNQDELLDFLKTSNRCANLQVQKYIDKEYEFQLLGCSINSGEDIIIPGRTHIYRPNGIDNTFFLKFDRYEGELQGLVDKSKQFIRETGYTGLFSVEFLVSKSGEIYFTEMNFRNDGNAICVTASGINLPYIYFLANTGRDYEVELSNYFVKPIYLMPEVSYFSRLLAGEFGFKEWWTNMKRADCYTTFFKNDKRTFFWFLLLGLWKRIYRK